MTGLHQQNTISIHTSRSCHLHNPIPTKPAQLDKTNRRSTNLLSSIRGNSSSNRRRRQNRHTKPKRNAKRTRTPLPNIQHPYQDHGKTDNHLPKDLITFGSNLCSTLVSEEAKQPPSILTFQPFSCFLKDESKILYQLQLVLNVEDYVMHEFDVVIIEDETGGYIAFVPALPGCHTQGDTQEELMKNIKEAIELYT